MKFLIRNKIFVAVLSLLFAGIFSFVALPKLYSSQFETQKVLMLNTNVEVGEEITENMLTLREMASNSLPKDVVSDADEVIGLVATAELFGGEYVSLNRLTSSTEYENSLTSVEKLVEGEFLLAVELPSTSAGVAGALTGGNLVDVYAKTEVQVDYVDTTVANLALENVQVVSVLNGNLEALEDNTQNIDTGIDEDKDVLPVYVLFSVNQEEASTLIALEADESLHLVLKKDGE